MQLVSVLLAAAAVASHVNAQNSTADPMTNVPGGWFNGTVTMENLRILNDALAHRQDYYPTVTNHICAAKVLSVETQVVAGTNYRFHVIGNIAIEGISHIVCMAKTKYSVEIFDQPWTHTRNVTAITQE